MPKIWNSLFVVLCALTVVVSAEAASSGPALELFGKGSYSKSYIDAATWTESISGTAGIAFILIPQLRLEGRYMLVSQLQNVMALSNGINLNSIKTESDIYSVGIDWDILSDKYSVQPYLYLGVGYLRNGRSYYLTLPTATSATYTKESPDQGPTANTGLGFRVRIARSVAFEVEAYSYIQHATDHSPLINIFGSLGLRIFL